MKKIPTLFLRDPDRPNLVTSIPHTDCLWVLAGEGVPTRKLDGTACLWKGSKLWKRYEAVLVPDEQQETNYFGPNGPAVHIQGWKPKGPIPADYFPAQADAEPPTKHGQRKLPGWVPVGAGPEDRWHREAKGVTLLSPEEWPLEGFIYWARGLTPSDNETLELIGPKVNGNPEGVSEHLLILHGPQDPMLPLTLKTFSFGPRSFAGLRSYLEPRPMEGIVFWHPDGRMAKIKRRDLGLPWPVGV